MASFNKIIIVGNLGRDPELKYTPQGTAVCNFSVATTEKRKSNGETQETTTWFRVTLFGRQAEIAQEYLAKGRQVYVEGRLKLAEFTDRDGNKRTSAEVTASDFQMLGSNQQGGGEQGDQRQQQNQAAANAQAPRGPRPEPASVGDGPTDDDIWF